MMIYSSKIYLSYSERKLMHWGFDDIENKIVSPTPSNHFSAQSLVKFFGDDNGIQGYLDVNGNLHRRAENIFKFPAKCTDVAQMWTGNDVIVVTGI